MGAFTRNLLLSAMAMALVTAPLTVENGSLDLVWKTALAKKDGNGGGHGGGRGGGRDHSDRGNGHGRDAKDGDPGGREHAGGGHGRGAGYHDFGEFVDHVRSGKAFGVERRDERVAKAKDRYRDALQQRGSGHGRQANGGSAFDGDANRAAHRFSPNATKDLIEHGWRGRQSLDGFKNHGQRVRTMVEIAKRLGYDARVGALQGNFGTPFENDIAELQAELDEARAVPENNLEEVEDLEAKLAAAIAAAKPGNGPSDDWATADLDFNNDSIVDQRDLAALDAQADDQEQDPDEVSEAETEDEISETESEETPAS
jgi:hypothetical protein